MQKVLEVVIKKKLGTIGDIATLSFYANKIITTGENGAILTNSKKVPKCEILRDQYEQKERYVLRFGL